MGTRVRLRAPWPGAALACNEADEPGEAWRHPGWFSAEPVQGRITPCGEETPPHELAYTLLRDYLSLFVQARGLGRVLEAGLARTLAWEPALPDWPDLLLLQPDEPGGEARTLALAVETAGPRRPFEDALRCVEGCMARGAAAAWLVEPARRQLRQFRRGLDPRVLAETEWLDDPEILPGFRVNLRQIFG